jgi:hypothetical protein
MQIYCIDDFLVQFEKLKKKKPYKTLEKDLLEYFFNKNMGELLDGIRLNNNNETPYIKKRLNGSGGYRMYYLVIIKNNCLYLMFVHPKNRP